MATENPSKRTIADARRMSRADMLRDGLLTTDVVEVPLATEDMDSLYEDESSDEQEDYQAVVTRLIQQAKDYYEQELEPHQLESIDYFYGRPFGDEEEGRSKVVNTVERDTIEAIKPSLLRIFLGGENSVEYRPRNVATLEEANTRTEQARQATDTINYCVREDGENEGFRMFNAVLDDALMMRIGALKYWWEEKVCVKAEKMSGLSEAQMASLTEDETLEITAVSISENEYIYDEATQQELPAYDVEVKRRYNEGYIRVEAIPPEECWYSPGARSKDDALCVVHVRDMYVGDLIAMGLDPVKVKAAAGNRDRLDTQLSSQRQFTGTDYETETDAGDMMTRKVKYAEAYIRADVDGDEILERRLFKCVGPEFEIINTDSEGNLGEIVDHVPFAFFSMRPLAHMLAGLDVHDFLRETQRVMSQIERGMMDSLSLAIEPKTEVVDGRVNIDDLMDPSIHNIIRVDAPGMMREVKHEFIGGETLPVLGYYTDRREESLGITKASQGLDADSLQSSTKAAVTGTLRAAQQRLLMITQSLAETGMKDLFRGALRLFVQHQQRTKVIKLRGKWVEVDPRGWDADMAVQVNVGLGAGTFDERMQTLKDIAADHETHMAAGSPLVSWQEVSAVRRKIVELSGFPSADEFYKPFGPQEAEQYAQAQQQQQQQSDPAAMLADIERQRMQNEAQAEQAKLQQKQMEMDMKHTADEQRARMENDREVAKMAQDFELRKMELEMKYKTDIDEAVIQAAVDRMRAELSADAQVQAARENAAAKSTSKSAQSEE